MEYTSNAALTTDNQLEELIAIGYIGATLLENEGPVQADISASLNHQRYTKDTFADQRYFNLVANASWEMSKDRFIWLLQDFYAQRPINVTDAYTPDNIQDINSLILSTNIVFPVSARQTFTLLPEYRNFYYDIETTDNQQFLVAAGWDYELDYLTSVGVDATVRAISYDEPLINDVRFASIFFTIDNVRPRSEISANLGTTYVERDNGQSTEEFAGYLNWSLNLSSRSWVWTDMSTDLTDTSSGTLTATLDPDKGNPDSIQVTTDVIRNQVIALGYRREDGTLKSSLISEIRKVNYSESPNDLRIWRLDALFNYPVTALLRGGFYMLYNNTDYLDQNRVDNNFTVGSTANYQLSRNLNSTFEIRYRDRGSTVEAASFDEWSVYATLVYGFGQPLRPTRLGNF